MTLSERFGTRHRAALGITEETDAIAVVVSEESGQMSVVERARIVRVPNEAQLERALIALLERRPRGGPGARPAGHGGPLGHRRRRIRRDPRPAARHPTPPRPSRPLQRLVARVARRGAPPRSRRARARAGRADAGDAARGWCGG